MFGCLDMFQRCIALTFIPTDPERQRHRELLDTCSAHHTAGDPSMSLHSRRKNGDRSVGPKVGVGLAQPWMTVWCHRARLSENGPLPMRPWQALVSGLEMELDMSWLSWQLVQTRLSRICCDLLQAGTWCVATLRAVQQCWPCFGVELEPELTVSYDYKFGLLADPTS